MAKSWKRRQGKVKAQAALLQAAALPPRPPQRFTPGQVARALGVSPRTVSRWCEEGQLSFESLPSGHRRIAPEALAEFQKARQGATTTRQQRLTALTQATQELATEATQALPRHRR